MFLILEAWGKEEGGRTGKTKDGERKGAEREGTTGGTCQVVYLTFGNTIIKQRFQE